jgi:hypothetical protein
MKQLAVFKILKACCVFVCLERRDFLSLALPGIVVLAILRTLTDLAEDFGVGGLVNSAASLAAWVLFAVAWHRSYLVPNEVTTVRAALRWRRRHTRFFLLAIGVGVLVAIVPIVPNIIGASLYGSLFDEAWQMLFLAIFTAYLPMLLIYARLSLLFPSTAVDHRMSFSECWRFTRGNSWRLALIIFLIAAPIWVVTFLINVTIPAIFDFLELLESLTAHFARTLLNEALWFIGIAVAVSALSISYRELMVAPPDEA